MPAKYKPKEPFIYAKMLNRNNGKALESLSYIFAGMGGENLMFARVEKIAEENDVSTAARNAMESDFGVSLLLFK